jgi:hypothetical protein
LTAKLRRVLVLLVLDPCAGCDSLADARESSSYIRVRSFESGYDVLESKFIDPKSGLVLDYFKSHVFLDGKSLYLWDWASPTLRLPEFVSFIVICLQLAVTSLIPSNINVDFEYCPLAQYGSYVHSLGQKGVLYNSAKHLTARTEGLDLVMVPDLFSRLESM